MPTRLSTDVRLQVLLAAKEEASLRGDRRLGTDHLLLGLLNETESEVVHVLGISLESAREALRDLDRAALSAIGVEVKYPAITPLVPVRGLPPLTSGAREVIKQAIKESHPGKTGRIDSLSFALALLSCKPPDPAAELLRALNVDAEKARSTLKNLETKV